MSPDLDPTSNPAVTSSPPGSARRQGGWWPVWIEIAVALAVVVVVLGPVVLRSGFVLVGDMVFVPDQPWKDAWTGADGGVPRAVPADAVVSVLSGLIGGELLQMLVLAVPLVAGFLGMTRLTAGLPLVARLAGGLCFVWNPYVHERLAIGHWGLLCGYAALPWVALAVVRLRDSDLGSHLGRRFTAVLVASLLVAGWSSPTGALLTLGVAGALGWGRPRLLGLSVVVWTVVNLPWLLPAVLNGAEQLPADRFGVTAFASAADTPWGVLGSLFTFGGIWKSVVWPDVRGEWLFAVVALTVSLIAVLGLWLGHRAGPGGRVLPRTAAWVLGGAGLALAGLGSWEHSRPVVEWVVVSMPGGGLLRDGQKWVAWWVLVASVGFASAVARAVRWASRAGSEVGVTTGLCLLLLPVMALPTMALGLGGFLAAAEYPDDWDTVRAEMERRVGDADTVIALPFSTYRQFDWNARAVLDPASRYFPGTSVTDDSLIVPGGTVGGESAVAAQVRAARTSEELTEVLAAAGVRWVLVHRSSTSALLPEGTRRVVETRQLDLLEMPAAEGVAPSSGGAGKGWRAPLYGVVDLTVLCGSLILVICGLTSKKASPGTV
ncbi:hypothetical protein [Nocardioides yefusunii]|uniref:Uncharacterized protein n=1 Tax=Nocardioides yefusunii TaxID=2500546 RepID=A0ABW1QXH8_9ACTN|nr:hypothetical protein [Nocardioides yefusunii]